MMHFDRSAASFDNADHVGIVVHNTRWRLGLAAGEPKYDDLKAGLPKPLAITVPTITMKEMPNGAPHRTPAPMPRNLPGKYAHRTITGGIGHNLPQEAPQVFAEAARRCRNLIGITA